MIFSSVKRRTINAINADRMSGIYKEMKEKESGCLVLCMIEIFSYFFPNQPIPVEFEQRLRESTYSDLNSVGRIISGVEAILGEFQLGFGIDTIYLRPSLNFEGLTEEELAMSVIASKKDRISLPAAVLLRNPFPDTRYHIVPVTDSQFPHPFVEFGTISGREGVSQYIQRGFQPILVYTFKKS